MSTTVTKVHSGPLLWGQIWLGFASAKKSEVVVSAMDMRKPKAQAFLKAFAHNWHWVGAHNQLLRPLKLPRQPWCRTSSSATVSAILAAAWLAWQMPTRQAEWRQAWRISSKSQGLDASSKAAPWAMLCASTDFTM